MKHPINAVALAEKLKAAGKAGRDNFIQIGRGWSTGDGREIVRFEDGTELPGQLFEFLAAIGNPKRTGREWTPIGSYEYDNGWWIEDDGAFPKVTRVFVRK